MSDSNTFTGAMPLITTAEIDEIVRAVNATYQAAPKFYQPQLQAWRNSAVAHVHGVSKFSRRPYVVRELIPLLQETLVEMRWLLAQLTTAQLTTPAAKESCEISQ